jgi:hypothetical protein
MRHFPDNTVLSEATRPVIWHTDLHLGNIFVTEHSIPRIRSLIDWQSISVLPLFFQSRMPVYLEPSGGCPHGLVKPQLPENYDELDEREKKMADFMFEENTQAKAYEVTSFKNNFLAYKATRLPRVLKDLFTRTGEAYDDGTIAIRECLLQICSSWTTLGFAGTYPLSFLDTEVADHRQEFSDYVEWQDLRQVLIGTLCTDVEGWVSPDLDFEEIKARNREIFEMYVEKYSGLKTREECLRLWPYSEIL